MQLIPARGRLLSRHGKTERGNHVMQLSPARGRLRFSLAFNLLSIGMQLIPARGRLHGDHVFAAVKAIRCSLSPRGDGYCNSSLPVSRLWMQLSPARGRLQGASSFSSSRRWMQLSPARGRLLKFWIHLCDFRKMQLIPARGLPPCAFSGKFPSFY